jgi:hypothetical protein
MKVHIHGNCQAYVLGGMLGEVFPHWDITWSEVHTDEIVTRNEDYRRQVATADLVLSQPIHRGFREREDLSLDWVRGAVRDDAMLLVFPSMHFTGHHPSAADFSLPGNPTGDGIVATLVASGADPETVAAILTSVDLLDERLVRGELALSIAELARREVEDRIDISLTPLLEAEAGQRQLFHLVNHPFRDVYVFVLNEILTRFGFRRRASLDGKDWQNIPHLPLLPAVRSYMTRMDDAASGLVILPRQDPITQRQHFRAMAVQLAEYPATDLLDALAGRTWQRGFLDRFTASVTGGLSPVADGLVPGERVEAARQLAAALARLIHRNAVSGKVMEDIVVDPETAPADTPAIGIEPAPVAVPETPERTDSVPRDVLAEPAVSPDPDGPGGYAAMAEAVRQLGRLDEVEAILTEGVEHFPDDVKLAVDFANTAAHRGEWGEALARWSRVRLRFPGHPSGFVGAARAFREQGQFNLAEILLTEARLRFPDDPDVLQDLGVPGEIVSLVGVPPEQIRPDPTGNDNDESLSAQTTGPVHLQAGRFPLLRWSPTLIERLRREANDPAQGELSMRLRRALLAAGTNEASVAHHEIEEIARDYPKEYKLSQWFFDNYMLACMLSGAFGLASAIIHEQFNASWSAEVSIANAKTPGPVMRWEILDAAHSRFIFNPAGFEDDSAIGIILFWTRSMALYDGYHRSGQAATGAVDVNLFDIGMVPGLTFCDYRDRQFLVPDPEFLHLRGYQNLRGELDAGVPPWEMRMPDALWRGSTTGAWDGTNWRTLPRAQLCEIAAHSEGLIDAGISGVVQMSDQITREIHESGLMRPAVQPIEFAHHKYQIDIDGNTNAWSGLFHKLYSGSPVLKVQSPLGCRQWYYDRLVPWFNYVPVSSDMSDLITKIKWLRQNDDLAREIGRRGRELAASLDYEAEIAKAAPTITAALRQDAFLRTP